MGKPAQLIVSDFALREALGLVIHAAASDEARPILSSVFFEVTRKRGVPLPTVKLVASDNYRIAWAALKLKDTDQPTAAKVESFVISRVDALRVIALVKSAKGFVPPVVITRNDVNVTFALGETQVGCRLVSGTYPNYAAIIPTHKAKFAFAVEGHFLADVAKAFTAPHGRKDGLPATLIVELTGDPLKPIKLSAINQPGYGEVLMPVRVAALLPKPKVQPEAQPS